MKWVAFYPIVQFELTKRQMVMINEMNYVNIFSKAYVSK